MTSSDGNKMSRGNMTSCRSRLRTSRGQQGAVLYVALIMLILLALIGVVGMQVTGLQERMSANYRAVNLAFQNTEKLARVSECGVEDLVNRTSTAGCTADISPESCKDGFDPVKWVQENDDSVKIRSIGTCIYGNASLSVGSLISEDANPVYQITAVAGDRATDATSQAAIDTIFRP